MLQGQPGPQLDSKWASNIPKLDSDSDIKSFKHRVMQTEGFLCDGRPEITEVLEHAATAGVPITRQVEKAMVSGLAISWISS